MVQTLHRGKEKSTLYLLLGSDVGVVTTLSLSAVGSLGGELGVALSANHLIALVRSGEGSKGSLNLDATHTTTSESEDEMEGGLLLDVVVGKSSAVFELLAGEDKSLLIRRDTFLVLDLSPISVHNGCLVNNLSNVIAELLT